MKSIGKRKSAVANATMVLNKAKNGSFLINNKTPDIYFQNQSALISQIYLPIKTIQGEKKFDISIYVKGSGLSSQAGAIQLAIAKILNEHFINPNNSDNNSALISKKNNEKFNENFNLISKANKKKYRLIFKKENYLTSDPRNKERRKPGFKKARKSSQFSKR